MLSTHPPATRWIQVSLSVILLQLCSGQVSSDDNVSARSCSNHPPSLTLVLVDHMAVRRCSVDSGQVAKLRLSCVQVQCLQYETVPRTGRLPTLSPLLTILARPVQARPTALNAAVRGQAEFVTTFQNNV